MKFSNLLFLLLTTNAFAADFTVVGDISYFSNDSRRIASVETESAEDDTHFRYERDKNLIARELAREELRKGNVCLQQIALDLEDEIGKSGVRGLCQHIFRDEITTQSKGVCTAEVQARQETGTLKLLAVFKFGAPPTDTRQNRVISSLGRADFKTIKEANSQAAELGTPADNWKALLESGSCSFNAKVVQELYDGYMDILKEDQSLNRCNSIQHKQLEQLTVLQNTFREYVPDAWMRPFLKERVDLLLIPGAPRDYYSSLSECRSARRMTANRFERLQRIAATISEEKQVPALRPGNWIAGRELSSESDE